MISALFLSAFFGGVCVGLVVGVLRRVMSALVDSSTGEPSDD